MNNKFVISGLILLIMSGIFIASWVKSADLDVKQESVIYYDNNRNQQIEIIFSKKIAQLSGKNFGNLKLKNISNNDEIKYKNEKNNLTLLKNDEEVSIFIGEKEVFFGGFKKNNLKDRLTGDIWLWKDLILKDDVLLKPFNQNIFNLSFSENNNVLATTDCANFSGIYKIIDDRIEIVNLTEIKRFCDNRTGDKFVQTLKDTTSLAFTKDRNLILFLKDNSGSISFTKK